MAQTSCSGERLCGTSHAMLEGKISTVSNVSSETVLLARSLLAQQLNQEHQGHSEGGEKNLLLKLKERRWTSLKEGKI